MTHSFWADAAIVLLFTGCFVLTVKLLMHFDD